VRSDLAVFRRPYDRHVTKKRKSARQAPTAATEPRQLDLTQFASLEDAITKVEPGDRYLEVGKLLMPLGDGMPMTLGTMFWFSMITRSEGLQQAVAREIRASNPHAVFPLIRALAESVVLLIYVIDHPRYIDVLTARASELPKNGPKRKSIQALIHYASTHVPGMKSVYAELSEASHFGAVAMWAAHTVEGDDESGYRTSWTSYPRWRDDEQAMVACAQTLELAEAMERFLRQFAVAHVLPLRAAAPQSPLG
jgi:hypothetical protein